jgi:hypothetical protein
MGGLTANADQLSKKSLQIWQRRSKSGDQKSPDFFYVFKSGIK